jgi:hypothetical protein
MTQQNIKQLETELWDAADDLRANSKLTAGQLPNNWKGDRVTQTIGEKIIMLRNEDLDIKDILDECNISNADLNKFINESNDGNQIYDFAESIK